MKVLWCWRCKMDVPMLDEEEWGKAQELHNLGIWTSSPDRLDRFRLFLDYYNSLTGFNETEPNAIMHHRIAQYGPPCESCGKPYRTPMAKFCAACGNKRQ